MQVRSLRSSKTIVIAAVLVAVVIVEEVIMYKVRQNLHDPRHRAAAGLLLYGVAFSFVAGYLGPRLQRALERLRRSSRRQAGKIGLIAFYVCAVGALYWAVWVLETRGAGGLLPAGWR